MKFGTLFRTMACCAAFALPVATKADTFSGQTALAGSSANVSLVGFVKIANKYTDHAIEVNAGSSGSQFMLAVARGEADFASFAHSLYDSMTKKRGPFAKLENAPEVAENIRTILGFPGGYYHFLTFADSGIESFEDIRGRNIYLGPPNAAQIFTGSTIIEAHTGMKLGEDYESVRLDAAGGNQAFMDRRVDLLVQPNPIGGALIEQYGVTNEIRLLGLDDEVLAGPMMQAYFSESIGRSLGDIPADAYTGQVNEEPVKTIAFLIGIAAHKDTDEDAVYQMVKAMTDNFEEFQLTSKALFGRLTPASLVEDLPAPLHAGAVRAYREAGIDVPDALVPPEMQ